MPVIRLNMHPPSMRELRAVGREQSLDASRSKNDQITFGKGRYPGSKPPYWSLAQLVAGEIVSRLHWSMQASRKRFDGNRWYI